MKYILIVVFLTSGNGSRSWPFHIGVSMQEFSNKPACQRVAEKIKAIDIYKDTAVWCESKD